LHKKIKYNYFFFLKNSFLIAVLLISTSFLCFSKVKIVDTVFVRQSLNNYIYEYTFIYNTKGNLIEHWIVIFKDNQFVNGYKSVISRNSKEIKTQILNYALNDNQWYLYSRLTYLYDINDLLVEELTEIRKNNEWLPSKRNFYIYNSRNLKESEYSQQWNNDGWVNISRITYSYDDKDSITYMLSEIVIDNQWVYDWRITKKYDDNGNLTEHKYEKWKDWKLSDYWKFNYTYYPNKLLQSSTYEKLIKESFMPISKFEFFYDNKQLLTQQIEYNWKDVEWVGKEKINISYDDNSLIKKILHEKIWNGDWTQYKRFTYNYDQDKRINSIIEESFGTEWYVKTKEIYEYDNLGNEIRWRKQELFNDELIDKYLIQKDYDEDNLLTQFVSFKFNFDTMKWDSLYNTQKITIKDSSGEHTYYGYYLKATYKEISPTNIDEKEDINPIINNDLIQVNNEKIGNAKIFDLQGRLVKVLNSPGEIYQEMEIEGLPNGLYFIQIGSETQKFIKQ